MAMAMAIRRSWQKGTMISLAPTGSDDQPPARPPVLRELGWAGRRASGADQSEPRARSLTKGRPPHTKVVLTLCGA